MRLVGIQPMTSDHLEWQLTVPPGPEEQEASILLNLRPAQDPKKALRRTGVQRAGVVVTRPELSRVGPGFGWAAKDLPRLLPDALVHG